MLFLFYGADNLAKDRKINELKEKHLSSLEAQQFDYEVLHGARLDAEDLKKALIALPAVSPVRVILVRQIDKLSDHNKTLILEFVESKPRNTVLILDSEQQTFETAFLKKLSQNVKVVSFLGEVKQGVFDMTEAISRTNPSEALKILSQLLQNGVAPVQIMGAIVWHWGKMRPRVSSQIFQKGLRVLQEADLSIKRTRLDAQWALEMSIIKLCQLTGG